MYSSGMEKGSSSWRPNAEHLPHTCPRCGSSHTKFCYYNNYSLTQPRYFCKGCRRYWTKGGSLRNVPIGGGCRKTRRSKSAIRVSARYADPSISKNITENGPDHEQSGTTRSTNINLAAVYANFLRPKPQVTGQSSEFPNGICVTNPGIDQFPDFKNLHQFSASEHHLPRETTTTITTTITGTSTGTGAGFLEWGALDFPLVSTSNFSETRDGPLFGCGSNAIYFQGLESVDQKNDFSLAPLMPNDEVVVASDQEMMWLGSDMMSSDHTIHSNQEIERQSGQSSEQMNGNFMNPFSPLNLEALFRS